MIGVAAQLRAENRKYGRRFSPVDITTVDQSDLTCPLVACWRNRDFLAQLFDDHGHPRLTVNRARLTANTRAWADGISWDELMEVKSAIGLGGLWAVEVFPPDDKVVNVANMRHLWLLEAAPPFAWNGEVPHD